MQDGPVAFRLDDTSGSQPVILLFAPSERSPAYENQMALFSDDDVVRELDAVLVQIFEEGTSYVRGDRLDEASAEELRTTFRVEDNDFLIVFLGKKGKELHRSDAPVQPSVIIERFTGGLPSG